MKRMSLAVLALVFLATQFSCRGREKSEADISKELKSKGTTEVLKEAAKDDYDPPADGKLNDDQVRMYLRVREHEREIARVARAELEAHAKEVREQGEKSVAGMMEAFKGIGSAADFVTADIRAAQELGYNTAEYMWVKGKVLEASGAALTEKLQSNMEESVRKAHAEMKRQYDAAKDDASRKLYGEMLASYDEQMKQFEAKQADPAIAHNRQILSKYESELAAITSEFSKYEGREGEASKAVKAIEEGEPPPTEPHQ